MDEQHNLQDKLHLFFSAYKKISFKKGEIILQAEQEPDGVYYLVEGLVNVYAIGLNGDELVINSYKPYVLFPMSWVLNDSEVAYYHEALTPVTAWRAPKDAFLAFIKKEPEVVLDLVKRIYRGLDGYFMRMENLLSGTAKSRLLIELIIHAKRFGKIEGKSSVGQIKITEKDLAATAGITRETVSREMQKLKDKGIISIENKLLIVPDIEALEEELRSIKM